MYLGVQSGVNLSDSTSTATYKISVVNLGNVEVGLLKIDNLPANLDYELTDYTLKNKICDTNNKCSLGITKDFYLIIKYKDINITYGDVNGDGSVDSKDAVTLSQYISDWNVQINEEAADVNLDGVIDESDATIIRNYLAYEEPLPSVTIEDINYGDINEDGSIDNTDLELLENHLNGDSLTSQQKKLANVFIDSKIDELDVVVLKKYIQGETGYTSLPMYNNVSGYVEDNTLYNLDLFFDFQPFYNVTYTNITNDGYPTEVLGGDSLSIDFGDTEFSYLKVLIDDVITYNYSFTDGILTIPEVVGEVQIIDEAPIYLTNLAIYGNSVQDGAPSLDTPVEIESVGDKTINLFNINSFAEAMGTSLGDEQVENGLSFYLFKTNNAYNKKMDFVGEENKQYTLSFKYKMTSGTYVFSTYYSDGTKVNHTVSTSTEWADGSITTSANKTLIGIGGSGSQATADLYIGNVQLQEGTEATEYEPYGKYKVPVTVTLDRKNLLDFSNMKLINTTDTAVRGGWEFEFDSDTDVTISYGDVETLPTAIFLAKIVTDGVYGSNIQLTSNTKTISLKANEKLLVFVGSTTVDGSYNMLANNGVTWIQVETGDTATRYEPYVESKTYNIFLDEPLRKIGEHSDYIDFSTGQVVRKVRNISKNISDMNNSEDYPGWTNTEYLYDDFTGIDSPISRVASFTSNITTSEEIRFNARNTSATLYIYGSILNGMTQTELMETYPNLVVNLIYGLETTISTETIEVPTIPFNGYTVVNVDTEIEPSNILWN